MSLQEVKHMDKKSLEVRELLVHLVTALTQRMAELVTEPEGYSKIKMEAHLFRNLESNCRDKAEMIESFLADSPKQQESEDIIQKLIDNHEGEKS
jgi:hypothetical protein